MTLPRIIALSVALLSTLALAACGGGGPIASTVHPTVKPVAGSTASPTTTATPPTATVAPVDPDILFTISATVTLGTGEVGHVVQTVYKPVSALPDQSAVESLLDQECDGWRTRFPSAQYVHSTIKATTDGSAAWTDHWIGLSMNGWPVYTGDYGTFMAYCATVRVLFPGTIDGYTPVPAGGSPDAADGWATLFYGFGVANEPEHPVTPQPGDTVLSDCVIALGAEALATSAIAPAWPTTPQVYPGFTCDVNR
jgi:hypothetical protein